MRVLLQRVSRARVLVAGEVVGELSRPGLLALVGVTHTDGPATADALAAKVAHLRVLRDPAGRGPGVGDVSAVTAAAPVLVVSQFTLYADTGKGRRPSWAAAAPGAVAEPLVERLAVGLEGHGLAVARGRFGADMQVELTNDGPVTVLLETT